MHRGATSVRDFETFHDRKLLRGGLKLLLEERWRTCMMKFKLKIEGIKSLCHHGIATTLQGVDEVSNRFQTSRSFGLKFILHQGQSIDEASSDGGGGNP